MSRAEIQQRRLEIAVELAGLQEQDVALRRQMIDVEQQASAFQTELARLDLEENEIGPPMRRPEPERERR